MENKYFYLLLDIKKKCFNSDRSGCVIIYDRKPKLHKETYTYSCIYGEKDYKIIKIRAKDYV